LIYHAAHFFTPIEGNSMTARKQITQEDYDYGRQAEPFIRQFLNDTNNIARDGDDQYGPDVILAEGIPYPVEVERRKAASWATGKFPWRTVNIPERRWKKPGHLIMCNSTLTWCILIYRSDVVAKVEAGEWVFKSNRYVSQEKFVEIPKQRCLHIDLIDRTPRSFDRWVQGKLL